MHACIPEHGLVPVWFVGSCHILSSQSATDHSMIMMLHTPSAQFDVIETRSISRLECACSSIIYRVSKQEPIQCLCNNYSPMTLYVSVYKIYFALRNSIRTTQILERAWSSAFTRYPPKSESTSSPADLASSTLGSKPTAATMWSVVT